MRASDGHHHLSGGNVILHEQLEELFGSRDAKGLCANDIVGQKHRRLLDELCAIAEYQWRSGAPNGLVRGFLLSGPPGTGKTTLAKRLAYELGARFSSPDTPSAVLAFIDGGEISRSRYGESEERIRDIFVHARSGFTAAGQRSVLLFDDIESIFMARGSEHAKEWHFSQNSVFFHAVDNLDTSRSIIVLTSNRPDLIDEAIRDRFLSYTVDYPDHETVMAMLEKLSSVQQLNDRQRADIRGAMSGAIERGEVRSLRDVQRFVMRRYVTDVLGRSSLAFHEAE